MIQLINKFPYWKNTPAPAQTRKYKTVIGMLNQTGTDDPVSATMVQTINPGSFVWDRLGVGIYSIVFTGIVLPEFRTWIMINNQNGDGTIGWNRVSDTTIEMITRNNAGATADGILTNAAYEVRIYDAT